MLTDITTRILDLEKALISEALEKDNPVKNRLSGKCPRKKQYIYS